MAKSRVIMAATFTIVAASVGTTAMAFPSFSAPSTSASNGGNADAMQSTLLTHFATGQVGVLEAQSSMAAALGLKDDAVKLKTAAEAIKKGPTQDNIGSAIGLSNGTQDKFSAMNAQGVKLSDDAKKQFGDALVPYAVGVAALRKLGPDYENFTKAANQEISSAGPMSAMQTKDKLAVGLYVATNAPSYVANLTKASVDLVKFATANGIQVPKDATADLGM